MGIIVGRGQSRLQCDHSQCQEYSRYVRGENDGQRAVTDVLSKEGWQCRTDGKTYCPKHAWKISHGNAIGGTST